MRSLKQSKILGSSIMALAMVVGLTSVNCQSINAEETDSEETVWQIDKSKTATELDDNNDTTVTLALPAAEKTSNKVDVVFVMDASGYANIEDIDSASKTMLTTLKNQTGLDISIGIIKYSGWGYDAIKINSTSNQSGMIQLNDENYDTITAAMSYNLKYDTDRTIGGTNTEQPVRMANDLLASDTTADTQKYMVVLGDFHSYVYEGSATTGGVTYDNIPVGSTKTYSTDQTNLEDYTTVEEYKTWASLKNIYDTNNGSLPGSDWENDTQFFRSSSITQKNWINYDYSGSYDTTPTPANKWVLQSTEEYSANKTAVTAATADEKHVTGNQRSMLLTYDAMKASIDSGTHVIAYKNKEKSNIDWDKALYYEPDDMLDDLATQGATVYKSNTSITEVFENLTASVLYMLGSGTVTDQIGDDLSLITNGDECPFTLTLSGTQLTSVRTDTAEWSFGTADENGVYPYVVSYDETAKTFVWTINVPVSITKQVKLSYNLHLDTDAPGTYPTNVSAVLNYKDSDGNEQTPELFDVPTVTLKAKTIESDMDIPFDLLEDNGDGSTFINGPREVQVGDKVSYKATINLTPILDIVNNYSDSIGFIDGDFTMTLKGSDGLQFADGSFDSTDIKSYFAGDAVDLFELVEAPTYDSTTNTVTFHVKTINSLKTDGMLGSELSEKLTAGIYGIATGTKAVNVTDGITNDGYARMSATLEGTLEYQSKPKLMLCSLNDDAEQDSLTSSASNIYRLNLTGVQEDPDTKADPTLSTLGDDPADTVSATVTYTKPEPEPTPTTTPEPEQKYWNVTFVDCSGNTIAVQSFKDGSDAAVPEGFGTFANYTNVTEDRELKPTSCAVDVQEDTSTDVKVPDTADRK